MRTFFRLNGAIIKFICYFCIAFMSRFMLMTTTMKPHLRQI